MAWAACCQAQNTGSDAYAYAEVEIVEEAEPLFGDAELRVDDAAPRLLGRGPSGGKQADPSDPPLLASIVSELAPGSGLASAALAQAKASFGWWLAPEEMRWQHAEATRLVSKFCAELAPGAPVEPTSEDLDVLWTRCEGLDPSLLPAIVAERLAPAGDGGSAWQPCFRAVCVLEHWHAKGGAAKGVAEGALAVAAPLLASLLSRAPECRPKVLRFLLARLRADGFADRAREVEAKLEEFGIDASPEETKRRL